MPNVEDIAREVHRERQREGRVYADWWKMGRKYQRDLIDDVYAVLAAASSPAQPSGEDR